MKCLLALATASLAVATSAPSGPTWAPVAHLLSRGSCQPNQQRHVIKVSPYISNPNGVEDETRFDDLSVKFHAAPWMGTSPVYAYGYPTVSGGCVLSDGIPKCPCQTVEGFVVCKLRPFGYATLGSGSMLISIAAVDLASPQNKIDFVFNSTRLGPRTFSLNTPGCDFNFMQPTQGATIAPLATAVGTPPPRPTTECGTSSSFLYPLALIPNEGTFTPIRSGGMEKLEISIPREGFVPGVSRFQWWSKDVPGMTAPQKCTLAPSNVAFICDLSVLKDEATSATTPTNLRFRMSWDFVQIVKIELVHAVAPTMLGGSASAANGLRGQFQVPLPCAWPASACMASNFTAFGVIGNCGSALDKTVCDATKLSCDAAKHFGGKIVVSATNIACNDGTWRGVPIGCAFVGTDVVRSDVPACKPQTWLAYEGCPMGYEGATCQPVRCAPNFAGTPLGVRTCTNGVWTGTVTGCKESMPVEIPPCRDPKQRGYTYTCTGEHGSTCEPVSCAAGYSTTTMVTGKLACLNGEWKGEWFAGCKYDALPSLDCAGLPPLPTGYSPLCGPGAPTGSKCPFKCNEEIFYTGIPRGDALCFDGNWFVSVSGCTPKCTLPVSVCDAGVIKPQYDVRGVFAQQTIDESCSLKTEGQIGLVQIKCKQGYQLAEGTSSASLGASICIGGQFIGGFAANPPMCVAETAATMRDCKCGDPGAVSTASLVVSGLVRQKEVVPGQNEWSCTRVANFVTCSCKC